MEYLPLLQRDHRWVALLLRTQYVSEEHRHSICKLHPDRCSQLCPEPSWSLMNAQNRWHPTFQKLEAKEKILEQVLIVMAELISFQQHLAVSSYLISLKVLLMERAHPSVLSQAHSRQLLHQSIWSNVHLIFQKHLH